MVGWVQVAHDLLSAAVLLRLSVRGCDGHCSHPTRQHQQVSIERKVSLMLMGNIPLLPSGVLPSKCICGGTVKALG